MRDATDLAIVLKPCLGHRVGSVVGVAEPLRATLVRSGHLRCLRPPEPTPKPTAKPTDGTTKRARKPM